MDGNAVQRDLLVAFEYSHIHDSWVYPLADALAGVTASDAAWTPGPDAKGIWQIVLHMTAWNDQIVDRMRTRKRGRPPAGSWPRRPATVDEKAWDDAQKRLWNSFDALHAQLEATPADTLLVSEEGYGSILADLLCRLIHNAYHIGQITKLHEWRAAVTVSE